MPSSSLEKASELVLQSPAAARVTSNGVPAASVAIGSIVLFSAMKKKDGEEEENQFVGVFKKTETPQKKKNGQQKQNHHQQQQQQQQQKKDSDPTLPAVSIPLRLAAGEVLDDPRLDLPYVCGRFLTSVYRPGKNTHRFGLTV